MKTLDYSDSVVVHRTLDSISQHDSLTGKRLLIIGAERAAWSLHFVRIARNAGAHVFVALLPLHEILIQRLLLHETDPCMHSNLHLLVITNLFTGPDLESIATAILQAEHLKTTDVAPTEDQEKKSEEHLNIRDAPFDGCVTFQDNHVQLACELCNMWNLPSCDPSGVSKTIDKYSFRKQLNSVLCMKMEDFISEFENCDATDFCQRMNFPLVLKPSEGHGSRGIYLVHSITEMKEKRELYERECPGRFDVWIVEEYLDGPEVGIELIMYRGECYFASVMETPKTPPPFFQGVGRFVPSSLGHDKDEELRREAIATAKLLGLKNGVLDIDAKYIAGRGPALLEINCRMGGFSVGLMHQVVFGIDLVTQHIRCGCGLEPDFFLTGGKYESVDHTYAKLVLCDRPDRNGVLRNLTFDTFYESVLGSLPDDIQPYLKAARLVVQPDSKVSGGGGHHPPPILAIVVSEGPTLDNAYRKATEVHKYANKLVNDSIRPEGDNESSWSLSTDENIKFTRY